MGPIRTRSDRGASRATESSRPSWRPTRSPPCTATRSTCRSTRSARPRRCFSTRFEIFFQAGIDLESGLLGEADLGGSFLDAAGRHVEDGEVAVRLARLVCLFQLGGVFLLLLA